MDPTGYFSWKKFFGIVAAVALVIATAGAAAPGVAAAAGAYGAAEVAAGALASWATTAAVVSAASGAAYLATPSSSSTFFGAGVAAIGAGGASAMALAGPPGLAAAGAAPVTAGARMGMGTAIAGALAEPTPLGELLLAGGAAYILSTYGAQGLRQATEAFTQSSYDRDNAIISYYATKRVNAETILANRSFRYAEFYPGNRGGPYLHTNNTPLGARTEARHAQAVLQVYATPRKLLKLPFAPPYAYGLNQMIAIGAQKFGFDAMAFPSTRAPGTINYVFFRYEEAIPITEVP